MVKPRPLPLHIGKRKRETLHYALQIMALEANKPKPEIRLRSEDMERLMNTWSARKLDSPIATQLMLEPCNSKNNFGGVAKKHLLSGCNIAKKPILYICQTLKARAQLLLRRVPS